MEVGQFPFGRIELVMDYLPSSPRLNPPPLLRERDLRQRTSTRTSRRIHLHRHFSTLSRYCAYCHQHHTDPMTCGAKSAKVTRSFTGLTPSSSFGISQGKDHFPIRLTQKFLADTVTLSGIARQLPHLKRAAKDDGVSAPLSPGYTCIRAFPRIRASANASA